MTTRKDTKTHWKQQNERGTLVGMRILLFVYRGFGSRVCKAVLFPILLYFYCTNKQVKTALQAYYDSLLSIDPAISRKPLSNVLNFGFGIIDRLALWHGKLNVTEKINAHNADILYDYAQQSQRGGLIISSHLGNFDLCRAAGKQRFKSKINVIVDFNNAKKINQILTLVNQEYTVDLIPVNEINVAVAIQLREKIDAGEFIVIAGDRVADESYTNSVSVPFLGQPARFPIGPYVLAKVLECPIFSIYCFADKKGGYDVYFSQLFAHVNFSRRDKAEQNQNICNRVCQRPGKAMLTPP